MASTNKSKPKKDDLDNIISIIKKTVFVVWLCLFVYISVELSIFQNNDIGENILIILSMIVGSYIFAIITSLVLRSIFVSVEKPKTKNTQEKFDNGKNQNLKSNDLNQNQDISNTQDKTTNIPSKRDLIVDLAICSKEEILSLDGFNAEKAERFIKDRDNGKMWYDIDTFVQDFGLQPHEMIMIQDKIKFPDKPKNRYGRKLDI